MLVSMTGPQVSQKVRRVPARPLYHLLTQLALCQPVSRHKVLPHRAFPHIAAGLLTTTAGFCLLTVAYIQ